jgi:nitrate/nitrite transport system ATP-binding protein
MTLMLENPNIGIEIKNLSKHFPGKNGGYTALEAVDLEIQVGEFVSLIGHSGCGKSTLLSMIAGLEKPSTGFVKLEGQEIKGPGPDRAVVFQNYSLLPWLTVEDNVLEAVEASCPEMDNLMQVGRSEEYLRAVGLWQHRHKRPHEISGGMKQRVAIARAFAINPRVMLLDEPFGALDALTRGGLQEQLNKMLYGEAKAETVVMVTHDIDEAMYLSDRIVIMTNGPKARIFDVIDVPFARPRNRTEMTKTLEYAELRERLVRILTVDLAVQEAA